MARTLALNLAMPGLVLATPAGPLPPPAPDPVDTLGELQVVVVGGGTNRGTSVTLVDPDNISAVEGNIQVLRGNGSIFGSEVLSFSQNGSNWVATPAITRRSGQSLRITVDYTDDFGDHAIDAAVASGFSTDVIYNSRT